MPTQFPPHKKFIPWARFLPIEICSKQYVGGGAGPWKRCSVQIAGSVSKPSGRSASPRGTVRSCSNGPCVRAAPTLLSGTGLFRRVPRPERQAKGSAPCRRRDACPPADGAHVYGSGSFPFMRSRRLRAERYSSARPDSPDSTYTRICSFAQSRGIDFKTGCPCSRR